MNYARQIHPSISNMKSSAKMPGYKQLQDAGLDFTHREVTAYAADRQSVGPNNSIHIMISN